MSARSFLPLGLIPAATPPARIPGTALTPPSSHSKSVISETPRWPSGPRPPERRPATAAPSRIHRRGGQPRALVPTEHHVEVLDAVRRTALAEIVDGRH